MSFELRQSTAATFVIGPILDASGVEYASGVIADISISKLDTGTLTALASAATLTYIANGFYKLLLTTGNTDTLGRCQFVCNKAGYQMPPKDCKVISGPLYDWLILGTDRLDVNVTHMNDVSASAVTTIKAVQGLAVDGVVTTLTNLPAITANWLTAAGIAADALTAAKFASDVTTELQSGLATAASLATLTGYVDTEVAAIKAKTDNLPSDPADASDITASFTSIAATLTTIAAYIDTEVAAIKAKTDNLPSDPADQSAVEAAITAATSPLATAANLATVAGYLDTEIASILADTNELQTDWANGGRLDLLIDSAVAAAVLAKQILGNKHTVVESPTGTFTISVRNDADNATVRTIVYIPATGARTVS